MSDHVYVWRPGSRRGAIDPQAVGEIIEDLSTGEMPVSPEQVVHAAQPVSSPLHPLFEWDDRVAGHHWRTTQARAVVTDLRTMVVSSHGEVRENVRAFVSVIHHECQGYLPAVIVASNKRLMRQALAVALDELNSWRRRYGDLEALASVFEALDGVAPVLQELHTLVEQSERPEHAPA